MVVCAFQTQQLFIIFPIKLQLTKILEEPKLLFFSLLKFNQNLLAFCLVENILK